MNGKEAIKMLRTIERTVCLRNQKFYEAIDVAIKALEQPTIEPQQTCEYWDSESEFCALCRPSAQPRKGKWIHIRTEEDGNALYECSLCHMGEIHVPIIEVKYCWNCGAKMEAET